MSNAVKPWLFRILGAVTGVAITAVAGVKADLAHFGMIYPLIITVQALVLAFLGKIVREYGAGGA